MMLHIDQKEFLIKCLDVLDKLGHLESDVVILGQEHEASVYEDNVVIIHKSIDDKWMEIIRKYNNNSFYYMSDGETIRFDWEFVYLEDHINKLLGKI